jgi:hypothetical protein
VFDVIVAAVPLPRGPDAASCRDNALAYVNNRSLRELIADEIKLAGAFCDEESPVPANGCGVLPLQSV